MDFTVEMFLDRIRTYTASSSDPKDKVFGPCGDQVPNKYDSGDSIVTNLFKSRTRQQYSCNDIAYNLAKSVLSELGSKEMDLNQVGGEDCEVRPFKSTSQINGRGINKKIWRIICNRTDTTSAHLT
ncbi:hypothetical protein J6590_066141 [Homalodisca vitripennis]|nr:hypothetical protein J6590_066141 [Homalodisca vitripennis]